MKGGPDINRSPFIRKSKREAVMKRKWIFMGCAIAAAVVVFTGCATQKYVLQEVAVLDKKVEGVESSIEENQKRIKEHDDRLSSLGSLITEQKAEMGKYDSAIQEVKKQIQGNLVFEEMLRNNDATFAFDKSELAPEAKSRLDAFVEMLIAQDKGVYLEIQGHTDNTGPAAWNMTLGRKRAEAVRDYLHKKHFIPLHRMEVISYGSEQPIADNASREGRAQNRRVVILVYE